MHRRGIASHHAIFRLDALETKKRVERQLKRGLEILPREAPKAACEPLARSLSSEIGPLIEKQGNRVRQPTPASAPPKLAVGGAWPITEWYLSTFARFQERHLELHRT